MKKLCLAILMTIMFRSFPVYAVTYTSIHGADLGPSGNTSLMSFNVPPYFRVLIPPGATYVNLSMNCQNQAEVTAVARFGQSPSNYLPLPSSSSSAPKSLDQARTGNIFSGNSDGILNVTNKYFSTPLAESQAGWLYVDIVGGGVNHIDYDLTVNAAVYVEWYMRNIGNIDCSCAQHGLCPMCAAPATQWENCLTDQYCPFQYRNQSDQNQCQSGQCQNYVTCSKDQFCPPQYLNPINSYQCQSNHCQNSYMTCSCDEYCPSQYMNPADSNLCLITRCQSYFKCQTGFVCEVRYQKPEDSAQCQQNQCKPVDNINLAQNPLKVDTVSKTVGILGTNMEVTLTGTGFDENTKVSMYIDSGNRKAIIGSVDLPGTARCVFVQGDMAYVAVRESGLLIIDIKYPQFPQIISSVDLPGDANSVFVIDKFAYVSFGSDLSAYTAKVSGGNTYSSGLQIIDIGNPYKPQKIGEGIKTAGTANGVVIAGKKAFIADGTKCLQIIDIDKNSPFYAQIIGASDKSCDGISISVSENADKAYVAVRSGGLRIVDTSDPKNCKIIGSVPMPVFSSGVAVIKNTAYVTGYVEDGKSGLQVVDVNNPENSKIIGSVTLPGYAQSVTINDDKAYIADGNSGLQIINLNDPKHPDVAGIIAMPGYAYSVAVSKDKAYVARSNSLEIIDIREPKLPHIISQVPMPGYAESVAIKGKIAYVADGNGGLQIVDVGNPIQPNLIKAINMDGYANNVTIVENKAYVAAGSGCLQTIDIIFPMLSHIIGKTDTPADRPCNAKSVAVVNNMAYVADGLGYLQIIEVSDPSLPQIVSEIPIGGSANSVTLTNDYKAYVAYGGTVCKNNGLKVIDVKDPIPPFDSIETNGYAVGADVIGDSVYLATRSGGLQIIDMSDPDKHIEKLTLPGYANSVVVIGDTAYVADRSGGLQIVDVGNPKNPKISGEIATLSSANGVAIGLDKAYIADGKSGLVIVPLPVKIDPVAIKNNKKEISLILPPPEKEGDYSLRVYNQSSNAPYEFSNGVTFVNPTDPIAKVLHAKAIIVAGNKIGNKVADETRTYAELAYKALRYQGYTEDNINYLSSFGSDLSEQVNPDASKKNLENAITSWAIKDKATSEVLIYVVGHGSDGEFILAENEKVTAEELNGWLNILQSNLPETHQITFIYDSCQSGSFIPKLKGNNRIIITSSSSNQPTYFTGNNAFSYYFWSALAGETVRQVTLYDAFQFAEEQSKSFQAALIDANGDGKTNEPADIKQSKAIRVGRASFNVDMKKPAILKAYENHPLNEETSAILEIEVIKPDDNLCVWATIIPPNYRPDPNSPVSKSEYCSDTNKNNCLTKVALTRKPGDTKYTAKYDNFAVDGTYTVMYQAEKSSSDSKTCEPKTSDSVISIFSLPQYEAFTHTSVTPTTVAQNAPSSESLLYEDNNTFGQAKYIAADYPEPQHHTFYKPEDKEDWVKFDAMAGKTYTVRVSNMSVFCDPSIEIYDTDGKTLLEMYDTDGKKLLAEMKSPKIPGENKLLSWKFAKSGRYYVKLANPNPDVFGDTISYDLEVYQPEAGGFHGILQGKAPAWSVIKTNAGGSDIADSDGNFTIVQKSGNSTVTVWVPGYKADSAVPIKIIEGGTTTQDSNSRKLAECQSPTARIVSPSSATIIDKGQSVNFQGNVTGGKAPYEYFWYFGGAPNSDKKDPGNLVFDKPDNPDDVNIFYPVLYVKDADGCVGKSQSVTVKVNYVKPQQPEPDSGGGECFINTVSY